MKTRGIYLFLLFSVWFMHDILAQPAPLPLSAKEQSLVIISIGTATGTIPTLNQAFNTGLDAGLSVNEIKEELVQLYAYCGFPRSLNGLNTFKAVLDERTKRNIHDVAGPEPTPVPNTADKYEQGKKTLESLTGRPEVSNSTGMAAFAPAIDTFLKEHLFADIFGRGVLSNAQRELITITTLGSLTGLGAQLQSHLRIGLRAGLTAPQLKQVFDLVEQHVSKEQADAGRKVLTSAMN